MLGQDLRYTLRLMRRSPGFTAVAVLSLALGIGANTAIFSLLHTVLLRSLPVLHPEQLVEFLQKYPGEPRGDGYWDWASYQHFRDHSRLLSNITGTSFDNIAPVRIDGSEPETVVRENVLGNYFAFLGLQPALGRLIAPSDVLANGSGDVVVLSWHFWDSRFQRDPHVIGKKIVVNNRPMTVIGVAPRSYNGPRVGARTELWTPQEREGIHMLGRLKPGASFEQLRAEAPILFQFTIEQRAARSPDPQVRQMKVEVEPAGSGLARVRDLYGKPLVLLMAIVGSLLLLACVNLASLLLARGTGRQREMAIRVGLGASRARLVRQMLTESVLLSGIGAVAGLALAHIGRQFLVRLLASGRVHERVEIQVETDLTVLAFTAGIAVLTGLLFGMVPAWRAFRSAPALAMRHTGSASESSRWRLFGKGLVAAQVALSMLLATSAGVFLRHLSELRHLDLGFRGDHVLLVEIDPAGGGLRRDQLAQPYRELLSRIASIPGVRSASIAGCTPIQGCGASRFVNAEGFAERREDRRWTALNWVAPHYFETLGTPLVMGRDFSLDDVGRPRVAIINQAMARHYFPNGSLLGRHISIDRDPRTGGWYGDDQPYEIIGVVGDSRYTELREAPPRTMYFNMFQENRLQSQFAVRTAIAPSAVAGDVRHAVSQVLKTVPVTRVTTLAEQVDAAIVVERLVATLSTYFGTLGAVLTGIGIYGLLAHTVSRRTGEIGVRMALGATAHDVLRLVLSEALAMVAVGLLAGAVLVWWTQSLTARLIPDMTPHLSGPLVLGGAAMVTVSLLAAYGPVRRAARVDPVDALRES